MIDPKIIAERWRQKRAQTTDALYPEAGRNAQPEVRAALDRWKELPYAVKVQGPLWHWLLGDPTPVYKLPPDAAEYTDESPIANRTCGNCKYAYQHVVSQKYICSVIRGYIVPPGWCRLWDDPEEDFRPGHA